MIKQINNSYENMTVLLDGNSFENCTFKNCTLEFRGTDEVSLVSNTITNCQFSFSGAAANTIQFLKGLYHGLGPMGQLLVENMLSEIRKPTDEVKQK